MGDNLKSNESEDTAGSFSGGDQGRPGLSTFSLFERLLIFAYLKRPVCSLCGSSGLARSEGADPLSGEAVIRLLLAEQRNVFQAWLSLHLQEQVNQVAEHSRAQPEETRRALHVWLQKNSFQDLMPPDVFEVERLLFTSDMESVIELLRTHSA